ncbi:sensor histidine kinase [Hydrogenophaga sp. 5NK40-0174]|uniref:sensor histidine kinase n=1 Tax=Hydrogenophaga sp. 5NK40-0174 TaxID=3127649 RepID=UPI003101F55A
MKHDSRPSLRRQLLLWLLLPQLVLWAGGGLLAYRMALSYAEKGIDQSLTQSVKALARQVKPVGSGLLIDFPKAAQDVLEQDPDDRLSYMVSSPPGQFLLGNQVMPQPNAMLSIGTPYLYQTEVDGTQQRVVALDVSYGDDSSPNLLRVQVGKSLAVQQRITRELVADMLVPLLLLGALLSMLVYAGIQRGLAPLKNLTRQLEHRTVETIAPTEETQAPSEVQALVDAINQLLGEVQRSVHQEKRFINDAAHQLRTPLAGLISQVELAQSAAQNDPDLTQRLKKVHTGAERSAHLVHQLLTLARSESQVNRQRVDVAALTRDVAREWTPRVLAHHMDLGYEGEDRVTIECDKLQIREALSNLIDNATRYCPAGTQITLRVKRSRDAVLLMVEDDGNGLTDEELSQAFQRFWRGSQVAGGCGLGLSIVQEIARRHGGQATIERHGDHGLRITLALSLRSGMVANPPFSAQPHGPSTSP